MTSAANWFHNTDTFDSCIRYLCHKRGFAWASLIQSAVILIVPDGSPAPLTTHMVTCIKTFNMVTSSFPGSGTTLMLFDVHLISSKFNTTFP